MIFGADPLPFRTFYIFWAASLKAFLIQMSLVYNLPKRGRGRKLCLKGPNETLRHLHITNFGALNNLLQKELSIRTLYTHLIEVGERNQEKRLSLLKLRNGCNERSFIFSIQSKFKQQRIIQKLGSLCCAF